MFAQRSTSTRWTITQGGAALDVVLAQGLEMAGSIEAPTGWIHPVNLLRIASRQELGQLTPARALVPRSRAGAPPMLMSQEVRGAELHVTVGADRIVFRCAAEGCSLQSVKRGGRGDEHSENGAVPR